MEGLITLSLISFQMRILCQLTVPGGGRDLGPIFKALQVDNQGYVEGSMVDDCMVFRVEGSLGETRNALNDLLSCLQNAIGVADELSSRD